MAENPKAFAFLDKYKFFILNSNIHFSFRTSYHYQLGLLPGDILSITGRNNNNDRNNRNNPAHIIGTLHFQSPEGRSIIYNTDDRNWICDGETPLNQGICPHGCFWKGIDKKVMSIWGRRREGTTTCKFTIPCD